MSIAKDDLLAIPQITVYFISLFLGTVIAHHIVWGRRRGRLPPGPRGLPFVGNILDVPKSHQWKTFYEWSRKWGDIVSVTVLGHTLIILSSPSSINALLEKNSAISSDRPKMIVARKWIGWDHIVAMEDYGSRLRALRQMVAQYIGPRVDTSTLAPLLEQESLKFVMRVWHRPDQLAGEVRRSVGSTISMVAYGYRVESDTDPILEMVDEALQTISVVATPGATLVEFFPTLERIPAWLPGGKWKYIAESSRKLLESLINDPFEYTKKQMARIFNSKASEGSSIPSFTSVSLKNNESSENELLVKDAAASLQLGVIIKSVATLRSFFLAMMCYPEVQRRAQQEIHSVVGFDRLPCLADRKHLPYINAVYLEALRWNPVTPIGLPHRLSQDAILDNYLLPKGSTVIANIWFILHDPDVYNEPFVFKPERYLSSDSTERELDPRAYAFGFGRRVCPGSHYAEALLFLMISSSLAIFNITKPVEDGVVIEPNTEFTGGSISLPPAYNCSIKPRSGGAEALLTSLIGESERI
ncbi:cytochrome P450 [Wolfiporia cocos MD-104 SS10]|uniref:Cytochrome P450 n=1 Tax=Wolfiporia cocos (strain MD-104) TaxID=742152 RepID=A0A2H3JI09_WOLCO|nr:cytochrome P450 [Wolfiporia cocos MD-104 SS10]